MFHLQIERQRQTFKSLVEVGIFPNPTEHGVPRVQNVHRSRVEYRNVGVDWMNNNDRRAFESQEATLKSLLSGFRCVECCR